MTEAVSLAGRRLPDTYGASRTPHRFGHYWRICDFNFTVGFIQMIMKLLEGAKRCLRREQPKEGRWALEGDEAKTRGSCDDLLTGNQTLYCS